MGNYSGAMGNSGGGFGFGSGAPSAPAVPSVPGQGMKQFGQGMSNFGNTLNQNGVNPVGNWFGQMGQNMSNFGQGMSGGMGRLGDFLHRGGSGWINAFRPGGMHHRNPDGTPVNGAPNAETPISVPAQVLATATGASTPETSDMQGSPIYQAWLNAKQYNNDFNGFNNKYQQLQQMMAQQNPGWTQADIDRNTISNLGGYLLGNQY